MAADVAAADVADAAELAEHGARFAHLLQPVRDLSRIWKMEIAEELEKYLAEVSQLLAPSGGAGGDGEKRLNFAEAALLIQGSTAIYSRKVELLYQLIYQALDSGAAAAAAAVAGAQEAAEAASGDASAAGGSGPRRPPGRTPQGFWAPVPETEELLTIDHLVKEGRNLTADPAASSGSAPARHALQRRLPLFLMPRDHADRRGTQSRISSCLVHPSGVYLLQASDARLLDADPTAAAALLAAPAGGAGGDALPAPPADLRELDDRLQELLRERLSESPGGGDALQQPPPDDAGADMDAPVDAPGVLEPAADAPLAEAEADAPAPGSLAPYPLLPTALNIAGGDPWALIDEHTPSQGDVPLKVGNTTRRVTAKRIAASDEEAYPKSTLALGLDALLNPVMTEAAYGAALPSTAAGRPVTALFLAAASRLRPGGHLQTQRVGLPPHCVEFEALLGVAAARRQAYKGQKRGQRDDGEEETALGSEARAPDEHSFLGPPDAFDDLPAAPPAEEHPQGAPSPGDDEARRLEVAALEDMIHEAQTRYETTIRDHLHRLQGDIVDADRDRFPQLYANVQRWQDQVAPMLRASEGRPEFDIKGYGQLVISELRAARSLEGDEESSVLAELEDVGEGGADGEEAKALSTRQPVPFERIARGHPPWEVCRRFLTCLALTNQGNTDIVVEDDSQRLNGFALRFLKAPRPPVVKAAARALQADDDSGQMPPGDGRPRRARRALAAPEGPKAAPASAAAATVAAVAAMPTPHAERSRGGEPAPAAKRRRRTAGAA
eukprot:TRINITY_DN1923_c0_g1_i1.p1 TRINITY_DN1923_c0_g1~~TRINITY_DN1923_c0_g1_i1.p1  ORF type:complete len:820 (+),score=197.51 TRINITY_DN1923_c0_g1_i1:113-2461(+)